MRRLLLVSIALITAPALTSAASLIKQDSPELKQCINQCRSKTGIEENEGCNIACVRADKKRHPETTNAPASPVRKK
jgi:hypothetical protein